MRYRLCDTEEEISGISVELVIQAEPFADEVPYELALNAGGIQVAARRSAAMTPAELFALGHALLDAAADGFGHFVPGDEVFGLDLAPPSVPGGDRRGGGDRVGGLRPGRRDQPHPKRRRRAAGRRCAARWRWSPRVDLRRRRPRAQPLMPSRSAAARYTARSASENSTYRSSVDAARRLGGVAAGGQRDRRRRSIG